MDLVYLWFGSIEQLAESLAFRYQVKVIWRYQRRHRVSDDGHTAANDGLRSMETSDLGIMVFLPESGACVSLFKIHSAVRKPCNQRAMAPLIPSRKLPLVQQTPSAAQLVGLMVVARVSSGRHPLPGPPSLSPGSAGLSATALNGWKGHVSARKKFVGKDAVTASSR